MGGVLLETVTTKYHRCRESRNITYPHLRPGRRPAITNTLIRDRNVGFLAHRRWRQFDRVGRLLRWRAKFSAAFYAHVNPTLVTIYYSSVRRLFLLKAYLQARPNWRRKVESRNIKRRSSKLRMCSRRTKSSMKLLMAPIWRRPMWGRGGPLLRVAALYVGLRQLRYPEFTIDKHMR